MTGHAGTANAGQRIAAPLEPALVGSALLLTLGLLQLASGSVLGLAFLAAGAFALRNAARG